MSSDQSALEVAVGLISDGAREADVELQMQDPNLVIPTSLSQKQMSSVDSSVAQSLMDHSMSQEALVIDAATISGILPSTQPSTSAVTSYTDEKGNIYQSDMGQGDGPGIVPVAQTTSIPQMPRGGTRYIVTQTDEHGRKHEFIIHQAGDSGELTEAQIQQIVMSQQAFTQPAATAKARDVDVKQEQDKERNRLLAQFKAEQEQQNLAEEQKQTQLLIQQKQVLEQQVLAEKERIDQLRKQTLANSSRRGKGLKKVQSPSISNSAILQQLTSPIISTGGALLPDQMLASQQMQEALKVLQMDKSRDVSKVETIPEQKQHVPALLKKRKRSSAEAINLDPHQLSIVDLPTSAAASTSALAASLLSSPTASDILKLLEREPSTPPKSSTHSANRTARSNSAMDVVEVSPMNTGTGVSDVPLQDVEILVRDSQAQGIGKIFQTDQMQDQDPFVPPPIAAIKLQRDPSPEPVQQEPDVPSVPSHIIPGVPPNIEYDDRYQWCNDCGKSVKALCKKHGELAKVKDRFIPSRAKLTTPHQVVVKTIELRAAGNHVFGVYAKKVIQNRTLFGPYEGEDSETWNYGREDRLKLRLFKPNGRVVYLDCTNQNACNWMMFVRSARNYEEQNLVAYQHAGRIYFATVKPVSQNEELRVWYAEHYAHALGEPLLSPMIIQKELPPVFVRKPTTEDVGVFAGMEDETAHLIDLPSERKSIRRSPRVVTSDVDLTDGQDTEEFAEEAAQPSEDRIVEIIPEEPEREEEEQYEEVVVVKKRGRGRPKKIKEEELEENEAVITLSLKAEGQGDNETALAEESDDDAITSVQQLELKLEQVGSDRDSSEERGRRSKQKRKGRPIKRKRGRPAGRKVAQKLVKEEEVPEEEVEDEDDEYVPEPVVKRRKGRPPNPKSILRQIAGKVIKRKLKKPKSLYHCDECDKAYLTQKKLDEHKFMHSGEKPFKCSSEECSKAFSSKFKLIRHELIHQGEKKHMCPYCQKSFTRKDHLKNHLKVHDPNKTVHICPKCSKEYASSFAFRTHMAIHAANEGELMCGVCKEEFSEKPKLIAHLKIHAGARSIKDSEKNQKCPFCDKMFFTRKDVKRHLVVHTKDRDFLCQYCPQRFGRRDHLVRHLKKAHANEAAADGFKGVLPDTSPIKETTPGGVKGRGKKSLAPQAPGPSEESLDRRLEGHATMVSELLQSVGENMANELPIVAGSKTDTQNNTPRKQQAQQLQVSQQLQQVLLQSPSQSGTTQYITVPVGGQSKTVPIQFIGSPVQGISSSGFVPPVLSANVMQSTAQQHHQTTEQNQQQQVAASMIKLGQNYVQLMPSVSAGSETIPIQQGTLVTGALVPGPTIPPVSSATNTVNVLDLLTSNDDRDAAQKLTLLSNAASVPQDQIQQGHLVSYNDAIKLASFSQFADNTGSQT